MEQKYQQSIWTEKPTINFDQKYQQSISKKLSTINSEKQILRNNWDRNIKNQFEQKSQQSIWTETNNLFDQNYQQLIWIKIKTLYLNRYTNNQLNRKINHFSVKKWRINLNRNMNNHFEQKSQFEIKWTSNVYRNMINRFD